MPQPGVSSILTLPLDISIITVMDALSHSFEAIWNKNANKNSTKFAIISICSIISNIEKFKNQPSNLKLRNKLLEASTIAGLAFSNTKTAAAHSISYPLTIRYNIPHGVASSLSLLPLLKINGPFIKNELDIICKNLKLSYEELDACIARIPKHIIPFELNLWRVKKNHINKLAEESFTKGRMDNNIVDLNINDVRDILYSIY